ncbi:serine proteinase stubble-like [Melanaphis sacchari]|uniref:serine proteinase stubble-like n=1 Tax=Melanaphis sacchari TaxID=742174 RepID=UPI000DC1494A|nr:serine proteinase stubble-like [Melanaphis sacchari]
MSSTATMVYVLLILSILSIISDVYGIILTHTQLSETSTASSNENITKDVYSWTKMDNVKDENNSSLNISNYEEVTHSSPDLNNLTFTPWYNTFAVENNVSNTTDAPLEEKSTFINSSTIILTTTDSPNIENGSHNMSNTEEVMHSSPDFNGITFTPSWYTFAVENYVSNTTDAPPEEKNTYVDSSTITLTTTDSLDIGNSSHNMSKKEEDKSLMHSTPDLNNMTFIHFWYTFGVENNVSNTTDTPSEEKNTYVNSSTIMLTITDSRGIENGPHNMSNKGEVHISPSDFLFILSRFKLPVKTHEFSNTINTPLENNIVGVNSSTTTLKSKSDEVGNNAPLVAPKNVEVTHKLSAVDDSNISPLYTLTAKTHINNTFGKPLTESSTREYPSKVNLTTATNSTDTEKISFNMSNYKDACGRQLIPITRIVGGDNVAFGEWPWQISLRHKIQFLHKCGAVLFNENWAITTAHCVINVPVRDLHLLFGENDLSVKKPHGNVTRTLQKVIIHPKFKKNKPNYDLALLQFDKPVKFQPNILPVCIPEDDLNFVGFSAHVTGWGTLYYGGNSPSILQGVAVPVISNSACEKMFRAAGYIKQIPDTFICAGTESGGVDACKGDSGGPLVVQRPDKRWVVVGIVSWGMRCGEPNSPGVYMRISKFKDWINQIILQS